MALLLAVMGDPDALVAVTDAAPELVAARADDFLDFQDQDRIVVAAEQGARPFAAVVAFPGLRVLLALAQPGAGRVMALVPAVMPRHLPLHQQLQLLHHYSPLGLSELLHEDGPVDGDVSPAMSVAGVAFAAVSPSRGL